MLFMHYSCACSSSTDQPLTANRTLRMHAACMHTATLTDQLPTAYMLKGMAGSLCNIPGVHNMHATCQLGFYQQHPTFIPQGSTTTICV